MMTSLRIGAVVALFIRSKIVFISSRRAPPPPIFSWAASRRPPGGASRGV